MNEINGQCGKCGQYHNGPGRTGEVYDLNINPEVLMLAFRNTVALLKEQVVVTDPSPATGTTRGTDETSGARNTNDSNEMQQKGSTK